VPFASALEGEYSEAYHMYTYIHIHMYIFLYHLLIYTCVCIQIHVNLHICHGSDNEDVVPSSFALEGEHSEGTTETSNQEEDTEISEQSGVCVYVL